MENGKQNAIHAPALERTLNMEEGHTQEPTREIIRGAILDKDIPIGSTVRDGYFLIDSKEELSTVISEIEARIDGLRNRICHLQVGWGRRKRSRQSNGNWPK